MKLRVSQLDSEVEGCNKHTIRNALTSAKIRVPSRVQFISLRIDIGVWNRKISIPNDIGLQSPMPVSDWLLLSDEFSRASNSQSKTLHEALWSYVVSISW